MRDVAQTHRFARENSFSASKVSTFMSIMTDVLDTDRADGLRTMEGSFLDFKKAILAHSVERPPARYAACPCVASFAPAHVRSCTCVGTAALAYSARRT